jgi:hypothetical protein
LRELGLSSLKEIYRLKKIDGAWIHDGDLEDLRAALSPAYRDLAARLREIESRIEMLWMAPGGPGYMIAAADFEGRIMAAGSIAEEPERLPDQ